MQKSVNGSPKLANPFGISNPKNNGQERQTYVASDLRSRWEIDQAITDEYNNSQVQSKYKQNFVFPKKPFITSNVVKFQKVKSQI